MLSNFKKLVLSITVTEKERNYFVLICSDWLLYCEAISQFDKLKIMKLLNYLIEERPKSKRLLDRCISRFNRLNALRKDVLR
jgi:hypothetical protein